METFLLILKYVSGPVIGAVIGYFTNWLAVKMLFRPYYPKKIGKWQLPFTPGIIPRRKSALAKSIGQAVGEQLFTKADLASALTAEGAKEKIGDCAVSLWKNAADKTANQILGTIAPAEQAEEIKEKAENLLSDKIFFAVQQADLGAIIADEGVKTINAKKSSLGMLAMFLSDDLISSLAEKLGRGVNNYIENNGKKYISDTVKTELQKALDIPLSSVSECVDEQIIRNAAAVLYESAVKNVVDELAESVDIASVVEEKLNAMDVKELEKLILSVMKKELNAIVNLGSLIGFILGIIMIFI